MKLDRIIVAVDNNKDYYEFWPFVAKRWKSWGVTPTLIVVADEPIDIDESLGDVRYIKPHPSIPTKHQAQIVRFYGAAAYEDEVCIISDIDMMHLNKNYFLDSVKECGDDNIVMYSADAYPPGDFMHPAYPMSYMAAKGSTFKEIIKGDLENFHDHIEEWMGHGFGWYTDEKVFALKFQQWSDTSPNRATLLKRGFHSGPGALSIRRIDRAEGSIYGQNLLELNFYIDFHMPRPYEEHKEMIDRVFSQTRGEESDG